MAIEQATLEYKVDTLKRDMTKAEQVFDEMIDFDRKAKDFVTGLWPLPWIYDKLRKKWMKPSLAEIAKVQAVNEEICKSITDVRNKLENNTEAGSDSDQKAEVSLRESLEFLEGVMTDMDGQFDKFDSFVRSVEPSPPSAAERTQKSRSLRRFFHRLF